MRIHLSSFARLIFARPILATAMLALLLAGGCRKKHPLPLTKVPPLPAPLVRPPQPQPANAGAAAAPATTASKPEPAVTKPKPRIHIPKKPAAKPAATLPNAKPTAPATSVENVPQPPPTPRITIDNGKAADPDAIAPNLPRSDEKHHLETTAQLIQATEDNLRSLTRTLTTDEQSLLGQVRTFLTQARAAITDGDLVRAHNLALKARLLSDELVR